MGRNFRSPSQATTSSVFASYTDLSKRAKIVEKTQRSFRSCGKYIYNKEKNTFCNKSCTNWFRLCSFYLIFLVILFGIFFGAILLIMHFIKTNQKEAFFDKTDLVPGNSPAIGILPRLPDRVTTVIWYAHKGQINKERLGPEPYISAIDELLKPYDNLNQSMYVDCDVTEPKRGQYCSFSKKKLGPCGRDGYGYNEDKPCVYLKLNKFKGWIPKREEKPKEEKLKKKKNASNQNEMRLICDGITNFDKDHMGKLSFYPSAGFKDYYFPYDGSPDYRSPLVGMQLQNLDRGFVIGVRCLFDTEITNMQIEALHTATVFLYIDNK